MTILTLNRNELESQIGKIDKDMENKISMFGTPVEEVSEDSVSVEVFPNRPDLLSFYGFIRALKSYLKKEKNKKYVVESPLENYEVIIDKSVKEVRPFTSCAIVKGLKFDEKNIKEIIDLQEKLHSSYGKNRKKLAIGIYPLEKIRLPIRFLAKKPEEIKFQPLEFPREINGRQILSQHPTGREYSHLLKDFETYPIFEDSNGEILSMPPIINSEKTGKVSEKTRDIFIECSGFNKGYLDKTLNIIVTALADMGGKIFSMKIIDETRGNTLSPFLDSEKLEFDIDYINKNLGLDLNEKNIKDLLDMMGIGFLKESQKNFALIPPYRADILHQIDLAEEIAIAYGYDNFKPEIPDISTIGEENKTAVLKRKIAEVLIGLGLIEVSSFHLSTKEKQFKKIGYKEFKDKIIEVLDSKTENNILRYSLIGNLLAILGENSDASYPQKIFELGRVFSHSQKSETGISEEERLCIALCHEKANFTEVKQTLDYLTRMFDASYEIKEGTKEGFIEGRCGEIFFNNKSAGFIGEITPAVLKNSKIGMPVAGLEINLDNLKHFNS